MRAPATSHKRRHDAVAGPHSYTRAWSQAWGMFGSSREGRRLASLGSRAAASGMLFERG